MCASIFALAAVTSNGVKIRCAAISTAAFRMRAALTTADVCVFALRRCFRVLAALQSSVALLGHSKSHHKKSHHDKSNHDKSHHDEAPANDVNGFCCHYSAVATDACNTCEAPSTTGSCATDAANCSGCGGAWCLAPTPAPTALTYVAPPTGVCCHYATDATDVCGTCKAPDDGNCGKDAGEHIFSRAWI